MNAIEIAADAVVVRQLGRARSALPLTRSI
jgi:hypothetical protein